MRCSYCGNENPLDNRFCGKCGRSLNAAPAEDQPEAAVTGGVRDEAGEFSEELEPEAPAAEAHAPAPAYTGGMFKLGGYDTERPSRNLDYLFEDEEPRSHRGLFVVLFLLALLLAGGFGYLRWRKGGLPGLINSVSRTATNRAPTTGPDDGAQPAPAASDAGAGGSTAAPNPTSAGAPASTEGSPVTKPVSAENKVVTELHPQGPTPQPPFAVPPATAEGTATPAPTSTAPASKPAAKPAPKPAPAAKPEDPVVTGEKYLYGRGVPLNCERGLRYVKPAADQSNSKAMITMGALYATGHCVARDLPTAYRFFALALRKDPENAALKQNAEMVWGQMTPSERQQAIRLTQ